MTTVAAGVGVHRATLYRHFPTRDALIGCLAERATAEGRHMVAEIAADPAELRQLRKLCTAMTEFGDKYQFLIGTAPVLNTGADPIGLAALMSRWQEAGILRGELTPSWLAASFMSLAIALHADSGPLSASVEFGCRAELLFESFALGAFSRAPSGNCLERPLRRALAEGKRYARVGVAARSAGVRH